MFGEQSALNDLPNPFTMIAATKKVEYYKIHRSHFTSFFEGMSSDGSSVSQMRANIILKNNWLCSKLLQMEIMDCSDLWKLEYCNDNDLIKGGAPTKTTIKEVPFIRNNPRAADIGKPCEAKEVQEMKSKEEEEAELVDTAKKEKSKKIEELRKQLLAPQPKRQPAKPSAE